MRALIITGLGGHYNSSQYIQLSMQRKGYSVDTIRHHERAVGNYDYVIAHSMGSKEATKYARANPNSMVFVMGAIVNVDLPNIISVGEYTDPVAVAGLILGGQKGFDVHTSETKGFNPHDRDAYFKAIENRIPRVGASADNSGFVQNPKGE